MHLQPNLYISSPAKCANIHTICDTAGTWSIWMALTVFAQFILVQSPNIPNQDLVVLHKSIPLSANQHDVDDCVYLDEDSHPDAEKYFLLSNQQFQRIVYPWWSNDLSECFLFSDCFVSVCVLYEGPVCMTCTMNLRALHSSGSCEIYLDYPFSV